MMFDYSPFRFPYYNSSTYRARNKGVRTYNLENIIPVRR